MQSSRSNVRTWQRREKDGQKLRRGFIRTLYIFETTGVFVAVGSGKYSYSS